MELRRNFEAVVGGANAPESCFLDVDTPEDYRRMLERKLTI
jgi:hypothetical protein